MRRKTSLPAPFSLEKGEPQYKHCPCCPEHLRGRAALRARALHQVALDVPRDDRTNDQRDRQDEEHAVEDPAEGARREERDKDDRLDEAPGVEARPTTAGAQARRPAARSEPRLLHAQLRCAWLHQ